MDLSDRNRPAVEKAAELLGASRGSVLLVHVVEEIEDVPAEELESFYRELRERAEAVLDDLRGELERRDIPVETFIRTGRRGAEIVDCAVEESCDLVLLRSHVLDPVQPLHGVGTISHQVALAAPCAVLLLR